MDIEVRFYLDIPEDEIEAFVGPDDGSDLWFEDAMQVIEEEIANDPIGAITKYSYGEPIIFEA